MRTILLIVAALIPAGSWWAVQESGVDSNLRGVCVATESSAAETETIWASGSQGALVRSTDSEDLAEAAHSRSGVVGFSRGAGVQCGYGLCDVQR